MRARVPRFVSPALFAAILAAFALPFGTVSCEGPPVRFTGYELATWTVPQTTPPATTSDGESLPHAIESKAAGWALLALLAAVLGAALGLSGRRGGGFAALAGLIAVAGLAWASFDLFGPEVEYEVGYVATAVLFTLAAVWHAALATRRRLGRRKAPRFHPPLRLPGL